MKETELRIGNYFNLYGQIATLVASDFSKWEGKFDNFKPIPLTEQWLKDFGFKIERPLGEKSFNTNAVKFPIRLTKNINKAWVLLGNTEGFVYCEYVHQIQNLYFALTHEELTK